MIGLKYRSKWTDVPKRYTVHFFYPRRRIMSKKTELSEKHWQALKLLESSGLSRKAVAAKMGYTTNHLDHLCSGDIAKCGYTADLFKKEYLKIQSKHADETKALVKENTKTAQNLIKRVFTEMDEKKKLTPEDRKILSMYTNALAKCEPAVNIKNLSYSYTKGLTAEELVHEFKRLKTIAEASFDRGGIRETPEGRSGDVPEVDE